MTPIHGQAGFRGPFPVFTREEQEFIRALLPLGGVQHSKMALQIKSKLDHSLDDPNMAVMRTPLK